MSIQFTVNNFSDEFYWVSTLHELVMKRKKILALFPPQNDSRVFSVSSFWMGSPGAQLWVCIFSLCCRHLGWLKQIKHWSPALRFFFFFSYWSCKTQIPESWYPHQTSELWGWLLLTVHTKTPHVWALPVGVQHLILESVPQRRRYCSDTNVQTPFGTSEKSIICTGTVWDGIMPLYEVYLVLLSDWTPKCRGSLVCPWSM